MSGLKKRFAVSVYATAVVKSKVIVEADSKEEALSKARNVAYEPFEMTDIDGNPIEGVGDLIWKYDQMGDENGTDPVINVQISHEVAGPTKK